MPTKQYYILFILSLLPFLNAYAYDPGINVEGEGKVVLVMNNAVLLNFTQQKRINSGYFHRSDLSIPNGDCIPMTNKIARNSAGVAVEVSLSSFIENELNKNDLVFVRGSYFTYFSIHQHPIDNYYIEYIDIEWSTYDDYDGKLLIHGTLERPYAKITGYSQFDSEFLTDDVLNLSVGRDSAVDGVSHITFKQPVRYIAFTIDPNGGKLVQLKSFTVSFVREKPQVEDDEINVTLAPDATDGTMEMPWSNGLMTIDNAIAIDTDKDPAERKTPEELGLQFTLTPAFDNAATKPSTEGECPEYMTETQWNIFKVLETNEFTYDGYLDAIEEITCDYDPVSNTLSFATPCSGRYTLSVSSEDYEISANEVTVDIWPDITNSYNHLIEHGIPDSHCNFSLNSVNFMTDGDFSTFHYPYAENSSLPYSADIVKIHIPGLYDYTLYYNVTFAGGGNNPAEGDEEEDEDTFVPSRTKRKASYNGQPEGYQLYSEETGISLEGLTDDTPATLSLKIAKNGVITPETDNVSNTSFTIALSDDVTIPTAVKAFEIQPADGETTYYNLHGIKVTTRIHNPAFI